MPTLVGAGYTDFGSSLAGLSFEASFASSSLPRVTLTLSSLPFRHTMTSDFGAGVLAGNRTAQVERVIDFLAVHLGDDVSRT